MTAHTKQKGKRRQNHLQPLDKKKIMFGKYAGTLISEVPTEYLKWFVANAYPQMANRRMWANDELERRAKKSQP